MLEGRIVDRAACSSHASAPLSPSCKWRLQLASMGSAPDQCVELRGADGHQHSPGHGGWTENGAKKRTNTSKSAATQPVQSIDGDRMKQWQKQHLVHNVAVVQRKSVAATQAAVTKADSSHLRSAIRFDDATDAPLCPFLFPIRACIGMVKVFCVWWMKPIVESHVVGSFGRTCSPV